MAGEGLPEFGEPMAVGARHSASARGYFTGRHLDNAFRKVVNASENPREALSDYILYINDEIEIKRKEFNLPY